MHILNIQKNISYNLVVDPTVSTIFIYEHFEKEKIFELKLLWGYMKKSVCTKVLNTSNIYINTGKAAVLLKKNWNNWYD